MANQPYSSNQNINEQSLDSVETSVVANESNQFDDDFTAEDLSIETYNSGEQNISGATEVTIGITERGSGEANVTVEWTDGAGNILFTESPSELQSISDSDFGNFVTKSTHVQVKISGTSTDVDGTINAH